MLQYYLAYGKNDEGGDFESVRKIADVFQKMGLLGTGVNKVNQVIEKMAPYLFPKLILLIFGTWPGHWAMISSGAYEKAKAVTLQDTNKYAGLIKKTLDGVKILGGGELTKKLTVSVDKVTESAKEKIEAAGGKVEVK